MLKLDSVEPDRGFVDALWGAGPGAYSELQPANLEGASASERAEGIFAEIPLVNEEGSNTSE